MRLNERDAAYLWDMLDQSRTIREITIGASFHHYMQNKILQLALERALEIIGEAARRISEGFKSDHPEIPWQGIIAQRNVIAHEYGEIKHERLWLVATKRIPELITILEKVNLPSIGIDKP